MSSGILSDNLSEGNLLERDKIRHLRIELKKEPRSFVTDYPYHIYVHKLASFPKLERFDVLVGNGLHQWTNFIKETY